MTEHHQALATIFAVKVNQPPPKTTVKETSSFYWPPHAQNNEIAPAELKPKRGRPRKTIPTATKTASSPIDIPKTKKINYYLHFDKKYFTSLICNSSSFSELPPNYLQFSNNSFEAIRYFEALWSNLNLKQTSWAPLRSLMHYRLNAFRDFKGNVRCFSCIYKEELINFTEIPHP